MQSHAPQPTRYRVLRSWMHASLDEAHSPMSGGKEAPAVLVLEPTFMKSDSCAAICTIPESKFVDACLDTAYSPMSGGKEAPAALTLGLTSTKCQSACIQIRPRSMPKSASSHPVFHAKIASTLNVVTLHSMNKFRKATRTRGIMEGNCKKGHDRRVQSLFRKGCEVQRKMPLLECRVAIFVEVNGKLDCYLSTQSCPDWPPNRKDLVASVHRIYIRLECLGANNFRRIIRALRAYKGLRTTLRFTQPSNAAHLIISLGHRPTGKMKSLS